MQESATRNWKYFSSGVVKYSEFQVVPKLSVTSS